MKSLKFIVLSAFLVLANLAHAQNKDNYKVTVFVENNGQNIGSWSAVGTAETIKANKAAKIINVVSPKVLTTGSYNYNVGFDIKMSIAKVSGSNRLMLASTYSNIIPIGPYTQKMENDESTITLGKVIQTQYNSNPKQEPITLNTITFTNVLDITNPRGVVVPIGRFVSIINNNQSIVTLKLKVELN